MSLPVARADIEAAAGRIGGRVRQTPVLEIPGGEFGTQAPVSLKLELLQHTGSFKPRGAFNNLLAQPIPPAGVTAASGGNHGAAVAYAAQQLGHRARIFVPAISSPVKIDKIRRLDAEIVVEGASYYDAAALCEAHAKQSGALNIHPYDTRETIAGQGTLAREWEAQLELAREPRLDTVLVAVGGGGLIGGIAAWFGGRVRVVGVEPKGSCALHAALAAGRILDVEVNSIAADSLGARYAGRLVFDIAQAHVERVVLVEDGVIRAAQRMLLDDYRIASEPGGATAFAALASGAYKPQPSERVGVLLCGGNVDLRTLVPDA
ncbi:MAG: threonine/serine dehydratase [Methylobacteriaceae bacterium]|nr:threonine/serine dehydratase [Methylobacteriaceae bacterium]